jgi:hypothetical protein
MLVEVSYHLIVETAHFRPRLFGHVYLGTETRANKACSGRKQKGRRGKPAASYRA